MSTSVASDKDALRQHKGLVILTVMMVAILEVLDSTIVNVSLPHMMGALGANTEQITWVLTSYIVASAIVMPLTGLLEQRLGRKELLLVCIVGFMLSSMLCGMSSSLEMIVVCRILQGAFGAALIPLSQVILGDTFSKAEQTKAMAIWGIGLMAAPVLGPTIGGYITEHLSWRWVFYINAPGCALSLVLAYWVIPFTEKRARSIDWLGMLFMAIAVGGLQLVLDQGQSKDWFDSDQILITTLFTLVCFATFLLRGWRKPDNIIKLQIFTDRNFLTSTLLLALFCAAMMGNISLQPIMLENIMGYPAIQAGLIMAPRGIACALAMMLINPLMKSVSNKSVLIVASLLCAYGTWDMVHYSANMNLWALIWPTMIQGFGMGLFFVPLSTQALASIPKEDMAEAAGLFGYGRMLGTSIGISLIATLISRETHVNYQQLNSHINAFNPSLQQWLSHHHTSLHQPETLTHLVGQTANQANMIAFLDGNLIVALAFLCLIPLVLLLKTVNTSNAPGMLH